MNGIGQGSRVKDQGSRVMGPVSVLRVMGHGSRVMGQGSSVRVKVSKDGNERTRSV